MKQIQNLLQIQNADVLFSPAMTCLLSDLILKAMLKSGEEIHKLIHAKSHNSLANLKWKS